MKNFEDYLIAVLNKTTETHGATYPITAGHMLNIVKLAKKLHNADQKAWDKHIAEAEDEAYNSLHDGYGSDD